eukprot:TRINITY_DN25_c0_g1_i1.p1 TRINITY_DN25_c0_g1~~TRINITY_DN25_c0_g1_i1.p1  ORF type:complete len:872 (+),score=253.43 TRINITY_DN25_c0_g1_i1:91-2616(+)
MAAEALIRKAMQQVQAPRPHEKVLKDEAVLSFETPYTKNGVYVRLCRPWMAFGKEHVAADAQRTGCPLYLHQKWTKRLLPESEQEEVTKLAIGVEGGFSGEPKTETIKEHRLAVVAEDGEIHYVELGSDSIPTSVQMACDAVVAHEGQSTRDELAAWQLEVQPSKYAKDLVQLPDPPQISTDPATWKCQESGTTTNLWLNLSDGHIGSGRSYADGSGGTGAAKKHFEETGKKYPLVVKLGTITAQGADVYSYAPDEDDAVTDPYLAEHLRHFGINIMDVEKTEKTTSELELQMNKLGWDSLDQGKGEEHLHGPGYQGLWNLGSSCYMNSVLQTMFAIPEVQSRYGPAAQDAIMCTAPDEPADDLITQFAKVGQALLSGDYTPPPEEPVAEGQKKRPFFDPAYEVRPLMFRTLVGRGHVEFSTCRQQDAMEYFRHLCEKLRRAEHGGAERLAGPSGVPTESLFRFKTEERTQCNESGTVRYKEEVDLAMRVRIPLTAASNHEAYQESQERAAKIRRINEDLRKKGEKQQAVEQPVVAQVPFSACLDLAMSPHIIQDFASPALGGKKTTATQKTSFKTFPRYLCFEMVRYFTDEVGMPQKMAVAVPMPEELDLTAHKAHGLLEGETVMPEAEDKPKDEKPKIVPDEMLVAQLISMGFGENGCKKACIACNNSGAEAAMEWVMTHMGDPDFNDPIAEQPPAGQTGDGPDPAAVAMLSSLGFTERQVSAALRACNNSQERAADWLFSRPDIDAAVAEVEGQAAPAGGGGAGAAAECEDGEGKYSLVAIICHQGSHPGSGHYVADIKKEGRWVRYNDDRVYVPDGGPWLDKGYVYVYRRNDAGEWN